MSRDHIGQARMINDLPHKSRVNWKNRLITCRKYSNEETRIV
jgi:hypothetical protein